MTGYIISSGQTTATSMSLLAVTYEIRISLISFWSYGGGQVFNVTRHEGTTVSGGSAVDVVPCKQGGPAASATAKLGTLTFTGTSKVVGSTYLTPGQNSQITETGVSTITYYTGSTSTINAPLTMTIQPGSAIHVGGGFEGTTQFGGLNADVGCLIYFEELRLAGSY